jgi:hypothetical protein
VKIWSEPTEVDPATSFSCREPPDVYGQHRPVGGQLPLTHGIRFETGHFRVGPCAADPGSGDTAARPKSVAASGNSGWLRDKQAGYVGYTESIIARRAASVRIASGDVLAPADRTNATSVQLGAVGRLRRVAGGDVFQNPEVVFGLEGESGQWGCARLVHDGLGIVYDLMWTSSQLSRGCDAGFATRPVHRLGRSHSPILVVSELMPDASATRAPCRGSRIRGTPSA